MGRRPLRVLYAAGPGDVLGTLEHWLAKRDDPTQVSSTYSGQFFDACERLGATAWVVGCGRPQKLVKRGRFEYFARRTPFDRSRVGVLYHVGQWVYGLWLWTLAIRQGADVAVITQGTHWHALALMRWSGVRVIPSIHTSFWPRGRRDTSLGKRVISSLDGAFWRRGAWATLALSEEIKRQLSAFAGLPSGPVLRWRLQFPSGAFDGVPPADLGRRPFTVMYGGRIERDKGVFELLEAAAVLEAESPGGYRWEVCGDGSDLGALRAAARARGLSGVFLTPGLLDREGLVEAFGRSHVVVVPTTARMTEGYARSAAEGVMAGRPVIVSSVVPAVEDLGEAGIEVASSDIAGYCDAVRGLAADEAGYRRRVEASRRARAQFCNAECSWGAAVEHLLSAAAEGRDPWSGSERFA